MILNVNNENFLVQDFKEQRFDLINMNPPWVKHGIKFIDKAIKLLKPGGKLITIMGTEQLAPMRIEQAKDKGTFFDLLQRGSFERFESRRVDSTWGCKPGWFPGTDNHCWFIWTKGITNKPFLFSNKTGDDFMYQPTGNEFRPPELANLNLDIFDWQCGIQVKTTIFPSGNIRFKWTDGKVVYMTDEYGSATEFREFVDPIKLDVFLQKYLGLLTIYHSKRITTAVAIPPIKRDILQKIKDNNA